MLLYHGSNVQVRNPHIIKSNRNLDFGTGFYTTSDYEQAKRWAIIKAKRLREGKSFVTCYDFDFEEASKNLKIKIFASPDIEWLTFVADNRKNIYNGEQYDVVVGPVANDRTILTINDYVSGAISSEVALMLLKPAVLSDQYVFLTKKSLEYLTYRGVDEVC